MESDPQLAPACQDDATKSLDTALYKQREDFLRALQLRLRTPVRANRVTLSLLLDGEYGAMSEEQKSVIAMLFENNVEIERLISMLVTLYRLQNGKAELKMEKVHFKRLIHSVLDDLQKKAAAKNAQLLTECKTDDPVIEGDAQELQRLFYHLIDNAVRYARHTVRISCEIEDSQLRIQVRDDGPGIPATDIPNLFERFFYLSSAGNYAATTGVGLCLCAEIVKAHHGKIHCHSSPDKGTQFIVELPLKSN